jgi:hypothetical protein
MRKCWEREGVVVLAPYPNNPNPVESFNIKTDFDLSGAGLVWYARPQLFFNCTLCPTGLKASVQGGSHKEVSLVYFSTFEPVDLTPYSIMQRAGVPMLYDSASNPRLPCFYICPVANMLGRAPLIPCLPLQGRSAYWRRLCRHAAGPGQRQQALRGEHLDVALWPGARGRPRMVSIADAERIRAERLSESRTRAAETRKRRSEAAAAAGAAQGGGGAD